jgi:hypothetical protein
MGHLTRKCRSPATCGVCGGEHPTARHDAAMKFPEALKDEEQKEPVKFNDKDKDKKQKPKKDAKKRGDKKAYSAEEASSDSSSNESESGEEEEEDVDDDVDAYHMRIVRNSMYGYTMMGGNADCVTNQSPLDDLVPDTSGTKCGRLGS